MKKHLVTFALLVAAIVLAVLGSATGFAIFLFAGIILEGAFWYRLLKR